VNPGGLVYMDVSQEVSAAGNVPTGSTSGNPPINQRQLQTQVAVQSGQTVLLGGLISETDIYDDSGIPLLVNIPVLGKLFGSTKKHRDRQEIIVLITPRVITNPDEAQDLTREYEQKFESLAPLRAKEEAAHPQPSPARPLPLPEPARTEKSKIEEEKPGEK
jgi:general secretion pathway protein D